MFLRRKEAVKTGDGDARLAAGISALAVMQHPDGSFPLQQWGKRSWARECSPLFSSIAVVLAVGDFLPRDTVSRAVEFVLRCRQEDHLWVFDPRLRLPSDADCTACALAMTARYKTDRKSVV